MSAGRFLVLRWLGAPAGELEALDEMSDTLRSDFVAYQRSNADDHRRLSHEAEQATARLGEDSHFLGSVREIIRFVKEA